jgi:hypothetical protein
VQGVLRRSRVGAAHVRPHHRRQVDGDAPHRFALAEQDSIAVALSVNELLTNAIKHGGGEVRCRLQCLEAGIVDPHRQRGRCPRVSRWPGCAAACPASGWCARCCRARVLAALRQQGDDVVARIALEPPGLVLLEAL